MAAVWVVVPCCLVEVYRRSRRNCCLHHQGDDDQAFTSLINFMIQIRFRLKFAAPFGPRNYHCRLHKSSPLDPILNPLNPDQVYFLKVHFNSIQPFTTRSTEWYLPLGVQTTKISNRVLSTPASCLEGPGFKSRPGDQLFWQFFSGFI
jgi:hypothetical protein